MFKNLGKSGGHRDGAWLIAWEELMPGIAKSTEKGKINRHGSPVVSSDATRVFILSDVRLFRDGVALLLLRGASVAVVGAASVGDASELIAQLRPDVVLLDATLRNVPGCAQRLREVLKGIKIVAFALGELDDDVIACAEIGISAFVCRDGSHTDLLAAIDQARRGEFVVSPRHAALLLGCIAELAELRSQAPATGNLTRREREIVPLIERGLSNKEIARQLAVGTATIKNHVHNILSKMQLRRRGEIAARARSG
jgi:two-component system nitrate/nitrite response regulator NarL